MRYVLFYESANDVAKRAPEHAAAHREHWHPFRERGELLLIGPFGDPQSQGVSSWEVREWDEAVGDD